MIKHQTEDFFIDVGQKIAQARKESTLSQAELARELNIKQQALAFYETGQRRVPLPTLIKISELLHASIEELLPIQQQTPRKRGPASKMQRQLEKIQALPDDKQKLIYDLIESLTESK